MMSDDRGGGDRPGGQGPGLRELMKSMFGFSWAMSLLGAKSLSNALTPDKTTSSLDAVTQATEEQLDGTLRSVFQSGDRLQRTMVDMMFGAMPGAGGQPAGAGAAPPASPGSGSAPASAPSAPTAPVDAGRLNRTAFVVLGEGLAAGAGDFALWDDFQRQSFPAQMARQMQAGFTQPLLQPPGIGNLPGFPPLPVVLPGLMQTTVLEPWPPSTALGNLSVPGFRLADALKLRPAPPLVHRDDARQTACNLILGAPDLLHGAEGELPTQLELALRRKPTLALLALGYCEAVEAVVTGDTRRLPDAARFRVDYLQLLRPLREAGADILSMNLPDPMDTACVSSIEGAAQVVKLEPSVLLRTYGLRPDDLITVRGLVEIGYQFLSRGIGSLPKGCVLSGETAGRISARVREINAELASLAREQGVLLCDLHGLFRRVRAEGVATGSRRLTADFLGGLYTLNGYYPGRTGHALIANEALQLLNQTYGAFFPLIDVDQMAASDPVVLYQPAGGTVATAGQFPPPPVQPPLESTSASGGAPVGPVAPRAAAARRPVDTCPQPSLAKPLELPPGLEQVLPLNKERSYYGDALRAVDCLDPRDAALGASGGVIFGGLALMDSHLSGQIRIRFSPPVNNVTQFELSVLEGLQGDDAILAAPQFYKLPGQMNRVTDFPGMVSTGLLDLTTGQLAPSPPFPAPRFNFAFLNTALLALQNVNPNFPQVPISFPALQPGQPGSASVQFTQRPDGKLDFELFGTTFLPLQQVFGAQPVRFPLPFAGGPPGPSQQFASIPTRGLALHPHIHLSTREVAVETLEDVPEIPTNTVRELTFITHNTSFGDDFTLTGGYLGGQGTGRSQLMGRLHVQFGEREGNTVPIYVSAMPPGGLLAPNPESPYWQDFEAQGYPRPDLITGPLGFNEFLRFPLRTFFLDDVFLLSDPFDLAVGAVDVRTGEVVGGQLHRGFIGQDVFFALLRVEPRTPTGSFLFHGPASFQKGPRGEITYRFCGEVHIPYPEGFLFPQPNLAMGFPAGPGSSLDPFFWIRAVDGDPAPPQFAKQGSASNVLASNGDRFSYSYDIPADPARRQASFTYENHSQQGSFRLRSLFWVQFANAPMSRAKPGDYDVVTLAGYGIWSKNGLDFPQPVTVQISTAKGAGYVGIQIDQGAVSNVNTKPVNPQGALP